jgi:hypothetical protein
LKFTPGGTKAEGVHRTPDTQIICCGNNDRKDKLPVRISGSSGIQQIDSLKSEIGPAVLRKQIANE